jgi:hypothetical protein
LSDVAKKHIENCCKQNGFPCDDITAFWGNGGIIRVFEKCNKKLDEMFCALLSWGVEAFVSQVRWFGNIDTTVKKYLCVLGNGSHFSSNLAIRNALVL